MSRALALLVPCALLLCLTGCPGFGDELPEGTLSEVPDRPSYDTHIAPIMAFYCNRCHGATPTEGAPPGFRLDVCEAPSGRGAKAMAGRIVARSQPGSNPMPPGGALGLTPIEQETVALWASLGAPCTPQDAGDDPVPLGGYHPEGWAQPTVHGVAAKLQEDDCRACHGPTLEGGADAPSCDTCHTAGWRTNCTRCHGGELDDTGAPPRGINPDETASVFPSHPSHVQETIHAAFGCEQCHVTPTDVLSAGHFFDDTPAVAEVDFSQGLSAGGRYDGEGGCSNLYCHGNGRANGSWSQAQGDPGCTGCHANLESGRVGWSRMSDPHEDHLREGLVCNDCHSPVVNRSNALINPALHVNGEVNLALPAGMRLLDTGRCAGTCHGEPHGNTVGRAWVD